MNLLSLLGTPVLGSIVGGVSAYFTKKQEATERQSERDHELKVQELTLRELALEQTHELTIADKNYDKSEMEAQYAVESIDASAFKEAIANETQGENDKLKYIKSGVRIVLTLGYSTLAATIFFMLHGMLSEKDLLAVSEITGRYVLVIDTILFLASSTGTFWFHMRHNNQDKERFFSK